MPLDSVGEEVPVNIQIPILDSDDLTTKQRKRRLRRMEIMRRKRQRTDNKSPVKASPRSSIENITDPKLLRKLRNREAAERSRRRITETIDSLTFQVCEEYVILQDLEQQYANAMLRQNENCSPSLTPSQTGFSDSCTSLTTSPTSSSCSSFDGGASPALSDLTDDDDSYSYSFEQPLIRKRGDLISSDMVHLCGDVTLEAQDFDRSLNEVLDLFLF